VKGNFYDGYNQNCIDLVLGKYKPKNQEYKKQKVNNFFILAFVVRKGREFYLTMNRFSLFH